MKKQLCVRRQLCGSLLALLLVLALAPAAQAQQQDAQAQQDAQPSPVGLWRTIDDETNEPRSIVEIYEGEEGKLYGKVVEILKVGDEAERNAEGQVICTACDDAMQGQPIEGMVIIKGMEADGDEWDGGTILDPSKGKTYKAKMSLQDANTLDVRGFVGFSFIGRTQTWERVTGEAAASGS